MNLPGAVFLAGSECQYKTAAVSRPAVEAEPCSYPAGGIPDISQPYPVVVACRSGTEAGTENPAVQAAGNTSAVVLDREAQSSRRSASQMTMMFASGPAWRRALSIRLPIMCDK